MEPVRKIRKSSIFAGTLVLVWTVMVIKKWKIIMMIMMMMLAVLLHTNAWQARLKRSLKFNSLTVQIILALGNKIIEFWALMIWVIYSVLSQNWMLITYFCLKLWIKIGVLGCKSCCNPFFSCNMLCKNRQVCKTNKPFLFCPLYFTHYSGLGDCTSFLCL